MTLNAWSEYSKKLLEKRAELDKQVAQGEITLDEAERQLGDWHCQNVPQE